MKIVFAPDKFKMCMKSSTVCRVLEKAFRTVMPDAELVSVPVSDGGEGMTRALADALHGEIRTVTVTGPDGKPVEAEFALVNNGLTAVFEMSSASGLYLVNPLKRDPMTATTYGTGEVIRAILDLGVRDILIGLGGSATVDGGAGMAQALGYGLLDAGGRDIPRGGGALHLLSRIAVAGADPRIHETRITTACDVRNPLSGPFGAAQVYGPQKGATPDMVAKLDLNLRHLFTVWERQSMLLPKELPGDGAAGGLGAGLRAFCGAQPKSGAELVLDAISFRRRIAGADLVVTGEGRTDTQTAEGKLCCAVADAAHREGIPVLLLSGAVEGAPEELAKTYDFALSTSTGRRTLEEAMAAGPDDLYFTAVNAARLFQHTARS
ncbi:MAG: glycerate kinase [Lentisphaeria bacterium]|nr:glycerate kinase [Lentisphaeria bacterium]